jgi:hypothetical protein
VIQTGYQIVKAQTALLLVAGLFFVGCKEKSAPQQTTNAASSGGNPITAPVDYLGAVGKAQKTATKTVTSAGLQQAIQMFYAEEGRFPKDLNELVPGQIHKVPPAPVGMKYDYDAKAGTLKIVPQ